MIIALILIGILVILWTFTVATNIWLKKMYFRNLFDYGNHNHLRILKFNEVLAWVSVVTSIICGVIFLFLGFGEHVGQGYKLIKWQERRNAIVYEMEHGFYIGDSLGEFNAELNAKQKRNQDPWFSWFEGDYIMEIEPIETDTNN